MGWADESKRGYGSGVFSSSRPPSNRPKYGWQQKSGGPSRFFLNWWAIYVAVTIVLVGLFTWAMTRVDPRTPLMVVAGVGYSAPTPPNVWAQEDADGLLTLDKVFLGSEATASAGSSDSDMRVEIEKWIEQNNRSWAFILPIRTPVVLYMRMPGLVDSDGRPCLLPPGASPLGESKRLWPVKTILESLKKKLPETRNKLLILDSHQHPTCWRTGTVFNAFHDRLDEVIEDAGVPNLAVLTSAGSGEKAWTSPELGGSAFGVHLRLALAGQADVLGDGDGKVSLNELASYLETEVDRWARSNRASQQRPTLFESSCGDFVVAKGNRDRGSTILAQLSTPSAANQPVGNAKIAELWQTLDGLTESGDLVRLTPAKLARIQHRLLTLEQLAIGGAGFARRAESEAKALESQLNAMATRQKPGSNALADAVAISDPDESLAFKLDGMHSLPLRELFAESSRIEIDRVQKLWERLAEPAAAVPVEDDAPVRAFERGDVELEATQFVVAARLQRVTQRGKQPAQVIDLLRLRNRAERLAAPRMDDGKPGDERAHYYVRAALVKPERLRRLAEDLLFLERVTPAEERAPVLAEIEYRRAAEVRDNMTEAYDAIDQAFAELPYLAEWACLPSSTGGRKWEGAGPSELASLARATHRLAVTLNELSVNAPGNANDQPSRRDRLLLKRVEAEVKQKLDGLRDQYWEHCESLGDANDGRELVDILAALSVPPLRRADPKADGADAEGDRQRLLRRRDQISLALHNDYFKPESDDPAAEAAESVDVVSARDEIGGWADHPLLALLGAPAEEPSTTLPRLEASCKAARTRLNGAQSSGVSGDATTTERPPGATLFPVDRQSLARASLAVRRAAPLGAGPTKNSPVAELRRFDLQQLLIWHAQRVADGFWHTVTGQSPTPKLNELFATSLTPIRDRPRQFFRQAAVSYLQHAEGLTGPPLPGVASQISRIRELLGRRDTASRDGVLLRSRAKSLIGGDGAAGGFRLDVAAKPGRNGSDLPGGLMAVSAVDSLGVQQRVSQLGIGWDRFSLPLPASGKRISADFPASEEPQADARVFFRGQVYLTPFTVSNAKLPEIAYNPPAYNSQSVCLVGDAAEPSAVVFILDCSDSMKASIKLSDESDRVDTRLRQARARLETLLEDLSIRTEYDSSLVGVILFGHRMAWKRDYKYAGDTIQKFIRYNPAAIKRKIRSGDTPAEDVEWAYRVGVFRPTQRGIVMERLRNVKPFGLTPVYLSIIKALDGLAEFKEGYARSIIVITDGKNEQEYPKGFKGKNSNTKQQVLDAFRAAGGGIPVNVLGFGINAELKNDTSIGKAIGEFKDIAKKTGGNWMPVDSGADLLRNIQERLDIRGYQVWGPDNKPITADLDDVAENVALGSEQRVLSSRYSLPADIELVYKQSTGTERETVTLEGGERLKLRAPGADGRFQPFLVDRGVDQRRMLQRGADGERTSYQLSVIPASLREWGAASFNLMLQDQEAAFTRRPTVVWVEVTPLFGKSSDGASPMTYAFADRVFKPGTVAPVVEFEVGGWPKEARQARVDFWCSYKPPQATKTVRLADVPRNRSLSVKASNEAQVTVSLADRQEDQQYAVTVVEQHTGDPPKLNTLRVWLEDIGAAAAGSTLKPRRVSHRFQASEGLVQRTYLFARGRLSQREFARRIEVRIESGERFKAGALQLAERRGLTIDVNPEIAHRANQLGE